MNSTAISTASPSFDTVHFGGQALVGDRLRKHNRGTSRVRRDRVRQAMRTGRMEAGTVDQPLDLQATKEALSVLEDARFEATDSGVAVYLTLDGTAAWFAAAGSCAGLLMRADLRHVMTITLVDDAAQGDRVFETVRRLAGIGLDTRVVLTTQPTTTMAQRDLEDLIEAGASDVTWTAPTPQLDWLRLAHALPRRPVGRG